MSPSRGGSVIFGLLLSDTAILQTIERIRKEKKLQLLKQKQKKNLQRPYIKCSEICHAECYRREEERKKEAHPRD